MLAKHNAFLSSMSFVNVNGFWKGDFKIFILHPCCHKHTVFKLEWMSKDCFDKDTDKLSIIYHQTSLLLQNQKYLFDFFIRAKKTSYQMKNPYIHQIIPPQIYAVFRHCFNLKVVWIPMCSFFCWLCWH